MTNKPGLPEKSDNETVEPSTLGSEKSGALVPSESIVDAVITMCLISILKKGSELFRRGPNQIPGIFKIPGIFPFKNEDISLTALKYRYLTILTVFDQIVVNILNHPKICTIVVNNNDCAFIPHALCRIILEPSHDHRTE